MFLFCNVHAVVLLLILTRSLVFVSSENHMNRIETLADKLRTVSLLQGPWINKIDTISRSSESLCADQARALIKASESGETWALEMLDASSKIQSGILRGNLRDLGMYDQCIQVNGDYNGTNIQGKHCTVAFGTVSSAVCVPSSCNETDVFELVNPIIQNLTGIDNLELEIDNVSCAPVGSEEFTPGEIVTLCIFAVIVAFIIFCTICEFVKLCRPVGVSPIISQLAKFSLYANGLSLLSTTVSPGMMPAIQGMRFFSMCWVILGHRYLNTLSMPMVNSLDILDWYDSWTAVYVQAAPFAVDTFFVISGFLMSYLFLKSKQAGKRTNYPMMYVHRYLRLTPAIGILMLFVAVLLHRVGNGPLWNSVLSGYVEPCRKNWWINLLYVQNLVRTNEMCLLHSWYLAVDMQLFWTAPFLMYILSRWPKWGLRILCLFLVASIVTPPVLLAVNSYSNALFLINVPAASRLVNFFKFYIPTYNRACAYFVGLILGNDAAYGKRHFTQLTVAINWAVACILMLICGLATQRVYSSLLDYDVVLETAFATLLRPFWSVAIAWIVYACTFGYGGAVTSFLSLPIFLPLSRLSYSIYLVHMVLQATKIAGTKVPGIFSDIVVFNNFWIDLIWSIVIAFVFSLFFESPVVVLEKLLTSPRGRKGKRSELVQRSEKDVDRGVDNAVMTHM